MPKANYLRELAQEWNCNDKQVVARLVYLGFAITCPRCGGSGRHSFCASYGDICFKCNGAGKYLKSITKKDMNQAKILVEEGALKPYFEHNAYLRFIKNSSREIMDAWSNSNVGNFYNHNWEDSSGTIVYSLNSMMCKLHDEAEELLRDFRYLPLFGYKTREKYMRQSDGDIKKFNNMEEAIESGYDISLSESEAEALKDVPPEERVSKLQELRNTKPDALAEMEINKLEREAAALEATDPAFTKKKKERPGKNLRRMIKRAKRNNRRK